MDPDEIQIFIKGIEGRTTAIDIHKDSKVGRIYELLSKKIDIPVEGNRLLYGVKELESDKFLSDYAPESLTLYCRSILNEGKWRFFCPHISQDQPPKHCNKEWDYLDVRRLAVLTDDEKEEFEDKITTNHLYKAMGIQECPKCKSMVERNDKKDVQLRCTVCSKKDGKTYEFCWHCLKEWYNGGSRTQCGNADCSGEDKRLKTLRECPRKKIGGVEGCPSYRACVFCGSLIEHTEACKHMHCRCGKDFCFVCLKPRESSGWKCGSSSASCPVAPVQTMIPGV